MHTPSIKDQDHPTAGLRQIRKRIARQRQMLPSRSSSGVKSSTEICRSEAHQNSTYRATVSQQSCVSAPGGVAAWESSFAAPWRRSLRSSAQNQLKQSAAKTKVKKWTKRASANSFAIEG